MTHDSPSGRWSHAACAALCLLLAAGGFLAGRRSTPAPSPTARSTEVETIRGAAVPAAASSAPTASEKSAAPASWDARWEDLFTQPSSPARNARLAALLEELAKTDPQRALALAQATADWRLRAMFRNAALRGWAEVAPDEAADWALAVRPDDRRDVVEAVMQGAARNPPEAVRVALRLCASDPERGGDYGHYTIGALVDSGAFESAVKFGLEVGTDKYPFLLKSALFQWARNQPAAALAALDTISDPIARSIARGEAIAGWAWADAKSLSEYALGLPPGGDRAEVLAEALPRWVEKDPQGAAEWINQHGQNGDADAGIAAMANLQSIIHSQPTLALDLARSISSPAERTHTLRAVFRQWAQSDPAAAQQFIASNSNSEERAVLDSEFKDLFPAD